MIFTNGLVRVAACCLALSVVACGGDDDKDTPTPDDNDGGAPSIDVPAPALGPADCATTTSKLTLTQPEGADVWGGVIVIEFEVEGELAQGFDLQLFDPVLGGWVNSYASYQASGQRDDGTYFLVVEPQFSAANKDGSFKVRVRPNQNGCPLADWTESESFTAGDPLVGTSWTAEVPGSLINGSFVIQRTPVLGEGPLPSTLVTAASATLNVAFGTKGELTQQLTLALEAEEDAPFADCTLALTFTGRYELALRNFGNLSLAISEHELTSYEGTTCAFPSVADLALAGEEFESTLNAYTQSVGIDYTPTVYVEPGSPTWQGALTRIFDPLVGYLSYAGDDESGYANGNVYVQEITWVRD